MNTETKPGTEIKHESRNKHETKGQQHNENLGPCAEIPEATRNRSETSRNKHEASSSVHDFVRVLPLRRKGTAMLVVVYICEYRVAEAMLPQPYNGAPQRKTVTGLRSPG